MIIEGPVLKYPGAKWNIARWIIGHFPIGYEKMTYLEPFFGSGAVFFNKRPSNVETINDMDGNVVNLFRLVRDMPKELVKLIELTPWARDEYLASYEKTGDPLEDARRFLVRCWQAFGTKTSGTTGWRNNIQGAKGESMFGRGAIPRRILQTTRRLQWVQIENQSAMKLIPRYAHSNVLIYADPPYVTRTRSKNIYNCEMSDEDHINLLELLNAHPGPVILSGYENELYDSRLSHWSQDSIIATAEKGQYRKEILWMNPIAVEKNKTKFPKLFEFLD